MKRAVSKLDVSEEEDKIAREHGIKSEGEELKLKVLENTWLPHSNLHRLPHKRRFGLCVVPK